MIVSDWGFAGGFGTGQSRNASVERCVNLYPEIVAVPGARPRKQVVLYPTPGLSVWATIGNGPIRAAFYQDGRFFVVSGPEFYEVSAGGVGTLIGTVSNDSNPAFIFSNGAAGLQLFIISGRLCYTYGLSSGTFAQVTDADLPTDVVMGGYLDGYFLALKNSSTQFNWSALLNGSSWPTASFATKTQSSDNIRALVVDHKEVWLLGSKATEVWYNTGDAQQPFAPVQGVLIEHGIGPRFSAAKINNTICWIGQDETGSKIAWLANGYTPERFSTHQVEEAWASYTSTIDDAYAWAYTERGHSFYVVTFPTVGVTWAYDFASNMWHERGYWENGEYSAHLGRCHAFAFDQHLVGSRLDGRIFSQSLTVYDDAGTPLRRLRRSPHVNNDLRWLFYNSFQLEM